MAGTFTFDQLAQTGGAGRFARAMTWGLIVFLFVGALFFLLLAIAWVVTGPMEASIYDSAPRCSSGFTDSCRGFTSGQITRALISGGQTSFDVSANAHVYSHNLTENAAPDLAIGEPVGVEVWRGEVVAITLPTGDRVITGSSPDWQKSNYVIGIVGVVAVPFFTFVAISRLRSVRRAAVIARREASHPTRLPEAIVDFAAAARDRPAKFFAGADVVRPTAGPAQMLKGRNAIVFAGAVVLLVLPIAFAIGDGRIPQTGRSAGAFFGSVTVLPLLVLLIVGLLVYRSLLFRNARIESTQGNLRVVDWLGREETWPLSSVTGFLLARIRVSGSTRTWLRWLIVGQDRKVLVRLNGSLFRAADIEHLANGIGAPVRTETDEAVDLRRLNQQFPGAAYWLEAHAGISSAAFVLVLIVAGLVAWLIFRVI
ncbi:MAG: hypothetical protein E6J06_10490 [Chloroflexi bacterium]|nr:MAG: hypothetical protein E6J06_10490 [Chloroflexota bacterium]